MTPTLQTPELEAAVREALRRVVDPCSIATGVPIDILDMGIVRAVELQGAGVRVVLRLTNPFCFQSGLICQGIEEKVAEATGLRAEVEVDPTDDWEPEQMAPTARARLRAVRPAPVHVVRGELAR